MAITGSGTQADPWLVSNYTDLAGLSQKYNFEMGTKYAKLITDINCNDYGENFVWNAVSLLDRNSYPIELDLDNHYIKNVLIAASSSMFSGSSTKIKNGKLLNVYTTNGAANLIDSSISIESLSISINANAMTGCLLQNASITKCAIHLETASMLNYIFYGCALTNSDFVLNIGNLNGREIFGNCSITQCRFQGKLGGNPVDSYPIQTVFTANPTQNSVFNMDVSAITRNMGYDVFVLVENMDGTTIICKDHWTTTDTPPSSWQYMTLEQMRDADYLNSNGFTVVEVGA